MNYSIPSRRAILAVAASGLAGIAGCVSWTDSRGRWTTSTKTRTERQTYTVGAGTRFGIRNRNGPITVEGYDGDVVEADIEIRGPRDAIAAVSVTADRTDDELRLQTEYESATSRREVSVALSIRCPRDVHVGRLQTVNGSVEVTDATGDPALDSQNGGLTARNVDGAVSLTTGSGRITAREIGGVAGANTSNGSIDIDVPAIEEAVEIHTTNGSIDANLARTLDADLSATTSNGSVELHDLPLDAERTSQRSVSGTLGDGGDELSFETTNGSIDLRVLSD